ncbi:MAG: uncharacterized protein K0S45_4336 [Nitrospira sp.]|nr:uncharacterized protein [Nitrospira sp.]
MPAVGVRGSRVVRTCTNLNPTLLTLTILAVATLLRLLFTPLVGSGYAFITYYPAIIFSTIVGGWKCGLFASVASEVLAVLIFIDPIANSEHAAALILFFLLSGMMIAGAEVVLRGRHQAEAEASLLLAREEALMDEIAARKRAEEALRESEERFRTLGDHMSQFAWMIDQSGDAVWFNRRWYEYTGTTFDEMRGWGWRKVHHPDHEERVVSSWRHAFAAGEPWDETFPLRGADGQYRWFLTRAIPIHDTQGNIIRWFGTNTDITALRDASVALQESQERLRAIVETAVDGIITIDESGTMESINPAVERIFQYPKEELIGQNVKILMPTPDHHRHDGYLQRYRETGERKIIGIGREVTGRRKDGSLFPIELSISETQLPGRRFFTGILRDISQRKQADAALRESQQDLNGAQALAHVGSWRLNVLHNALTWSDESYRIAGIPIGTPLTYESFLAIVHPDDRDYVERKWKAALGGEPYDIEHRFVVAGEIRWARQQAQLEFDTRGELVAAFGAFHDITVQKRIDAALRNRADQFETLLNQAPLGVYLVDADFRIAQVNPVARPVFGDIPDLIGRDFDEVIHLLWEKSYADEMVRIFRYTLDTGEPYMTPERAEFRIDRGVTEYYEWRLDRITLPDGRHGLVCYFRDISTHVHVRERIRESEARFRTMADVSPVIIWVTDATGGVEFINQAYRDFCGVTDDDVRERRWHMVVHPDDREQYVGEFLRCIQSKQPFYARCRLKRADGQWRWIASYGAPRFSEDGQFLGHVGSSPDIHDLLEAQERVQRWNVELEQAVNSKTVELVQSQERLRALATELNLAEQRERKKLAEELHDHLQQVLVLGKLKIAQAKQSSGSSDLMKQLGEIFSVALAYTRTLVAELSPPVLREQGLAEALKWLGEYMQKYGMRVCVSIPETFHLELPEDQKILLFQSVRELLINSSKHSGSHEAWVSIEQGEGKLRIHVQDKGVGFDLAFVATSAQNDPTGSLSSQFGLFSIRERMRGLGGKLDIRSSPGNGTTATLEIPVIHPKKAENTIGDTRTLGAK